VSPADPRAPRLLVLLDELQDAQRRICEQAQTIAALRKVVRSQAAHLVSLTSAYQGDTPRRRRPA
jgi:hypothetical protein